MVDELDIPDDSDWIHSPPCDGTCSMSLYEGATLIATRDISPDGFGFATHIFTLTDGEKALISNWSNLAIWFSVNGTETAKLKLSSLSRPADGSMSLYVRTRLVNL